MRGKVQQREIVEVPFLFPGGKTLVHSALVISNDYLFADEEFFYALLMSTKNIFPKYTIKIEPDMLTKPSLKQGYFVTHLIGAFNMYSVTCIL